jgi:hypothetical protein
MTTTVAISERVLSELPRKAIWAKKGTVLPGYCCPLPVIAGQSGFQRLTDSKGCLSMATTTRTLIIT